MMKVTIVRLVGYYTSYNVYMYIRVYAIVVYISGFYIVCKILYQICTYLFSWTFIHWSIFLFVFFHYIDEFNFHRVNAHDRWKYEETLLVNELDNLLSKQRRLGNPPKHPSKKVFRINTKPIFFSFFLSYLSNGHSKY